MGGVANATLLVSLILTGGALTLGISTVLTRDVYATLHPNVSDKALLRTGRFFTAGTGLAALAMVLLSAAIPSPPIAVRHHILRLLKI